MDFPWLRVGRNGTGLSGGEGDAHDRDGHARERAGAERFAEQRIPHDSRRGWRQVEQARDPRRLAVLDQVIQERDRAHGQDQHQPGEGKHELAAPRDLTRFEQQRRGQKQRERCRELDYGAGAQIEARTIPLLVDRPGGHRQEREHRKSQARGVELERELVPYDQDHAAQAQRETDPLDALDALPEHGRRRERSDDRLQSDDERDHARRHAVIDRGEATGEIATVDERAGHRDVRAFCDARRPAHVQQQDERQHEQQHEAEPQRQERERLDVRHAQLRADETGAPQEHEQGGRCTRPGGAAHLHAKQALDVPAQNLRLVLGIELDALHPRRRGLVLDVREIDGEQNAIDANLLDAAEHRGIREEAARGDVEVLAERLAEVDLLVPRAREHRVDAPQQERQAFTEVADDDLEVRILFEHTAQDQPHPLRRSLDREAPRRVRDLREIRNVILVIGFDHRRVRPRRMYIYRYVQRLRALEDRPEALVVDEKPARKPVNHRAFHPELRHAALELVRGGFRIGRRQRRERLKARRVAAHSVVQAIVRATREAHRELRLHEMRPRRRVRKHLHVDAGVVHLLQPLRAEVLQPLSQLRPRFVGTIVGDDLAVEVVLFDGDDLRFLVHSASLHARYDRP